MYIYKLDPKGNLKKIKFITVSLKIASSEPESLTEIKAITHYSSMGALFLETKI